MKRVTQGMVRVHVVKRTPPRWIVVVFRTLLTLSVVVARRFQIEPTFVAIFAVEHGGVVE